MLASRPPILSEEAITRPVASIPLGSKFWLKDSVKGPIPYICLPADASIEEIVDDNFTTLISGLRSVYNQFSVRKYHTSASQEKSYLRNPVNGQQLKPFRAEVPVTTETSKRQRADKDISTGRTLLT